MIYVHFVQYENWVSIFFLPQPINPRAKIPDERGQALKGGVAFFGCEEG